MTSMSIVEMIRSRRIKLRFRATGEIAYVDPEDWTNGGYHITNTSGKREWVSIRDLNNNYEDA